MSKARIVSEHAYGLTKGRWRVLQKRLDEDSDRIPDTIIACCILHNICIIRGDHYEIDNIDVDDDDDDSEDDNGVHMNVVPRSTINKNGETENYL